MQVDEAKEETDSGLLLTSASKEQPTIGKVASTETLQLLLTDGLRHNT